MKLHPVIPGDTIGVIAPSSYVERADIEASAAYLEARGYRVRIHPQTFARDRQSAGTHAEKLAALHELYADPAIKAIWAAGGGNRAYYLLDGLDFDLIARNPKPLIGFSDVTVLLNAIAAHCHAPGIHATVFKNLHRGGQDTEATLELLSGASHFMDLSDAEIMRGGSASGPLVGGNLSLFHLIAGTKDCPVLDGAILFLEDCGDELSRFDRMFAHMKRNGIFERISGLVIGTFSDLGESGRPFGFTLRDIVIECVGARDIPVVMNAPFGHGNRISPLPISRPAKIDTTLKTLEFLLAE